MGNYERRFLTNVTLLEKAYRLDPAIEFMVGIDPTFKYDGHVFAENEALGILEYGRTVKEAMKEVKESFERRCRFYKNPGTTLTEDQEKMKLVYEGLNLEEGHVEDTVFAELGQIKEESDLVNKSELELLPRKTVINELNDSYYKAYFDGYSDAVKIWASLVEKLIEKLN